MPRHDSTLLRYEAWTLPWSGDFKRLITSIPVLEGTGKGAILFREVAGDGSMDIDLSTFDRIDDIISDTSGSLIRVYDGTEIIHEWLAERIEHSHSDEQRVASISGPSLQSAFDKWIVYPYDYPAAPSVTPDWIYGGRNQLSNPGFEDNNPTTSTYKLFMDATGGTFTLTSGGNTTAPIDYDVSDGQLEKAMEAIASIDDVNVTPLGGDVALAYQLEITATTGTFTLSDGTDTTSAIDHAASASIIETRIEADLGSINDVAVTDEGDFFIIDFIDPVSGDLSIDTTNLDDGSASLSVSRTGEGFEIEFVDPEIENNMTLNTTGLTGEASLVLTQEGELLPQGWTKSTQISRGTPREFGVYDAFHPSTSQAHSGTQSLFIDPGQVNSDSDRYAGAQQVIGVTPGQTYQAKIWIYPTASGQTYRLVVRGIDGDLLTDKLYNFSPPANTWTELVVPDVVPDESEVIFRIANIDPPVVNPAGFYIDDAELNEGQAASNVGLIVNELMDDATTDHSADTRGTVLTWVDYTSVTLTQDSSGVDWDQEISINIPFGATYGQAWDAITELGYEWKLVPKASPTATLTHDLHWYNKGNGDNAPAAAVTVRQGVTGGSVLKRLPSFTAGITEGTDGAYLEDSSAALSDFGRIEAFTPHRETADTTTLQATLDELFSEEADNRTGAQFSLIATHDHARPLIDFSPGDTVPMQMPPSLPKENRRIQRVDYVNSYPTKYVVVGSRVYLGEEAGAWELVRRMWRKFRRRDEDTKPGALGIGGGGGGGIDVAASDAPPWEKAMARYQCDGVDDHIEIMAALSEQNYYSQCNLSSGTFWIPEGEVGFSGQTLKGQGSAATLIRNQGTGTEDDLPRSSNGVYLVHVGSDAEFSDIGFWTTNDFVGTCIVQNYGYVHNIAHHTGNAQRFIFVRGSIRPMSHIQSWADYDDVTSPKAMIEFGEAWYTLDNLFANIRGSALLLDQFGIASISGASIQITTDHPGIIVDNTGYLAMGDVALLSTVSGQTSPAIEVRSYPWGFQMSNIVVNGFGYGLAIGGNSNGIDGMDIDNFWVSPRISGIDIDLGSTTSQDAETGDMMIRGYRCVGSTHNATGWGLRLNVAASSDSVIISDFDIRDMDEAGILLHMYEGASFPPVDACIVHDGIIKDVGKHGVEVARINAQVHDVVVDGAGQAAANTYDAFNLSGEMMRTVLHDNKIRQESQLRYGINVSEASVEQTVIVGNSDEGGAFGTDALNDQGTGTLLSYPSDATYGDNFFGTLANVDQIEQVVTASKFPSNPNTGEQERVPFFAVQPVTSNTITVTEATETESGETITPT